MTHLLDTDITASWLNGHRRTVELLAQRRQQGLAISLMTYGEIYEGVYSGRDPRAAERDFLAFLRRVDVLPISRSVLKRFARLRGHLRARGQLIPDPDLIIAATALEYNLAVVTGNRRHFGRIPELALYQEQ